MHTGDENQIYSRVSKSFRTILKVALQDGTVGGGDKHSLLEDFTEFYHKIDTEAPNLSEEDKISRSLEQVFSKITRKLPAHEKQLVGAIAGMLDVSVKAMNEEMETKFLENKLFHESVTKDIEKIQSDLTIHTNYVNIKLESQESEQSVFHSEIDELRKTFTDN
ncbi:hypothetical protein QAD02_012768 [Eretmocerus hayati]|uniref:Uncharacterized protein n=1 Tax=Eretmocerus hayati TaxID=131215 RepID=A0ACC2P1P1_9HYME|nr:hypothetical protein QAD02_012768 [Eretmocerus hayati]